MTRDETVKIDFVLTWAIKQNKACVSPRMICTEMKNVENVHYCCGQ